MNLPISRIAPDAPSAESLVEVGPGGVPCPAWEEGGRRCAFFRGVVHVWHADKLLFEASTQRRPPWAKDDYYQRMMEGL